MRAEPTEVYLGSAVAAVRAPRAADPVVFDAGLEAGLRACLSLAHHGGLLRRRAPVRVWLSGGLARPFVVEPVIGLRRWSEAQALADAQAGEATGFSRPCRVQLEDWPQHRGVLAVAVELETIGIVERAVAADGRRLVSIRPWWTLALERGVGRTPGLRLLGVADSDALTVLAGEAGGFTLAVSYEPRPAPCDEPALISRLMLSAGASAADIALAAWRADAAGPDFGLTWRPPTAP